MANPFLSIFLGAFKEAGRISVAAQLAIIKENNDEQTYIDMLRGGNAFFNQISKLTAKSKTKVDDAAVEIFHSAIKDAAEAEGIEL
jgi:hypothetical protein